RELFSLSVLERPIAEGVAATPAAPLTKAANGGGLRFPRSPSEERTSARFAVPSGSRSSSFPYRLRHGRRCRYRADHRCANKMAGEKIFLRRVRRHHGRQCQSDNANQHKMSAESHGQNFARQITNEDCEKTKPGEQGRSLIGYSAI